MKKFSSLLVVLLLMSVSFISNAQNSTYGDVNNDGEVNLADVNSVIDVILNQGDFSSADVNGDHEVTITDVNALIDIILNLASAGNNDWVDLGLPSGTIWATRNVGANAPEEYGDYFAWGETEPKDHYDWSTYKWCNSDDETMTKYCTDDSLGYNGFVDNKTELDPEDDAACVHYPGGRMPSWEQIQELCDSCTWKWTQLNGVNGMLVTGPNGNTMFLPSTGSKDDSPQSYDGPGGYYWSRTLLLYDSTSSVGLRFFSGLQYYGIWGDHWYISIDCRYEGLAVRAVRVAQN